MSIMFKGLGALLALYVVYAIVAGQVYARSGPGGRMVARRDSPHDFWVVVAIYAGLAAALAFVF